jgi:hypothetical protein
VRCRYCTHTHTHTHTHKLTHSRAHTHTHTHAHSHTNSHTHTHTLTHTITHTHTLTHTHTHTLCTHNIVSWNLYRLFMLLIKCPCCYSQCHWLFLRQLSAATHSVTGYFSDNCPLLLTVSLVISPTTVRCYSQCHWLFLRQLSAATHSFTGYFSDNCPLYVSFRQRSIISFHSSVINTK